MEQDLFHQVIASGQVLVQSDPLGNHVGTDVVLVRNLKGGDIVVSTHQVTGGQHGQLFLGMGVGVQLAQQLGVKTRVLEIFGGDAAGVQEQVHYADAVHTGGRAQPADAVFAGFIRIGEFPDFFRQVSHGHSRQGGDHLRGVFLFGLGIGGVNNGLLFFFRHAGFDFRQLLSQGSVLLFLQAGFRIGGGQGVQRRIRQPFSDGSGEEAFFILLLDMRLGFQHFAVFEGIAGQGIAVGEFSHNALDRAAAFHDQLADQLLHGRAGVHLHRIKTILHNLLQGVVHDGAERFRVIPVDVVGHKEHGVVGAGSLTAAGEVSGREGLFQVLHQGRAGRGQQDIRMIHKALLFQVFPQAGAEDVVIHGRLIGRIGAFRHCVGNAGDHRLGDPGIAAVGEGKVLLLIGSEGFVQQLQESGVILKGTVQESETVGRMIEPVVVFLQGIPGHIRDVLWDAAGIISCRRPGEGNGSCVVLGASLKREGAGHFTVHGTVQRQGTVHILHFIPPGFRTVDAFIRHDHRMQAGVCIKIRHGKQLRFGKGTHRETGHVVGGISIHEGSVGLINQVEEQSGAGIFLRTRKGGVFKHVGPAGVVDGPGREGELEGTVGIFIGNVKKLCACLLMLEGHQGCADHVKGAKFHDFETFDHITYSWQTGSFGSICRSRLRQGGQCAEHQRQRKKQ